MDRHVKEFYHQFHGEVDGENFFHKVIALHESPHISWNEISKEAPTLCRGWYELAQLNPKDRIEFKRDFWLARLPYHAKLNDFLMRFFASLDDIGIFILQKRFDSPMKPELVYSLSGNNGFFRGCVPATDQDIIELQGLFPEVIFPEDYINFLQIHNGFCKTTDSTGIIKTNEMKSANQIFQNLLIKENALLTNNGVIVDPNKLIPFYESFGMPFFQCFWSEWYPEQEMGNVYYSDQTKTISDVDVAKLGVESMSFPTFTDWLMFYMEEIK